MNTFQILLDLIGDLNDSTNPKKVSSEIEVI